MKELVGREIAKRVMPGDCIGIGTGTTVDAALVALSQRVKSEGLSFIAVPTSIETSRRCEELGIAQKPLLAASNLSWGFDGADAVDASLRAIKGRGGALLREKVLAQKCARFVLLIDSSKEVPSLAGIPVPIEVLPEAIPEVQSELVRCGATEVVLRTGTGKHGPVITESGNVLIDASFSRVENDLEKRIKGIVGVIESGIFTLHAHEVLVATASGVTRRVRGGK